MASKRSAPKATAKPAKAKGLKVLSPRAGMAITGGKRTTVKDAHDKYANQ